MRQQHPVFHPQRTEWPTIILACLIYGGWITATALQRWIPSWLLLPLAAWLTAWHMSLQHEVMHGHPTRWPWLNNLIGFPPLSLWLPYARYREQHLGHHAGANLTDPLDDPESYYVTPEAWQRRTLAGRLLLAIAATLAGRMLLGPLRGIAGFLKPEFIRLSKGETAAWRIWLPHLAAVAVIIGWLRLVCHMSLLQYGAVFVYPGFALSLIRSFAEHRAAVLQAHRTAIVENTPLFGLLFLHNNLHVVHHETPGLSWYRIPRAYRADRDRLIRLNGGLVYDGYRDVARRYLFNRHDRPDHPG